MNQKILKPERITNKLDKWLNDDTIKFLKILSLSGHKIRFTSKKHWNDEHDDKRKEFDFLDTDSLKINITFTIKHLDKINTVEEK